MAHKIIAISRQFGSGGREIGMMVAERLGIKCYDKELIDMAAEHGDIEYKRLRKLDEKNENPWYHEIVYDGNHNVAKGKSAAFVLFDLESAVIRNIARSEDAVIVGRCADYILKDNPDAFHIFVHAAPAFRAAIKSTRFPRFLSGIHHILFNVSQLTEPSADFGSCRHTFLRRHKCQAALCVLCAENHTLRHHACQLGRL